MAKRLIEKDEWYPVFTIDRETIKEDPRYPYGAWIEFTEAELAEYLAMMAQFDRWQEILRTRHAAFLEARKAVAEPTT